jgi:hypothetical protein
LEGDVALLQFAVLALDVAARRLFRCERVVAGEVVGDRP